MAKTLTLGRRKMRKSIRKSTLSLKDCAGSGRFRIQEQGHSAACSMPWSIICRRRSMCRRWKATNPDNDEPGTCAAPLTTSRFLRWSFKSCPPVRRACHLHSRLFRRAENRAATFTTRPSDRANASRRLLQMHANKREEIDEVYAGDICACVGLKSVNTGDTLCDEQKTDHSRNH